MNCVFFQLLPFPFLAGQIGTSASAEEDLAGIFSFWNWKVNSRSGSDDLDRRGREECRQFTVDRSLQLLMNSMMMSSARFGSG